MVNKLEINVDIEDPAGKMAKVLASLQQQVNQAQANFERAVSKMIEKAGITGGKISASGGSLFFNPETMKAIFAPSGLAVGEHRLRTTRDLDKEYITGIKERMRQVEEMVQRARRLGSTAGLREAVGKQEELFSESVQKRVPARLFSKIEKDWIRFTSMLEEAAATELESLNKQMAEDARQAAERTRNKLATNKQQFFSRVRARGSFLEDIENAQQVAEGIENTRREHRYAREAQRRHRREQIEALLEKRDRARSQATMGMASVGIGLFGQAGFPLLNVAFASMSGMKYAGIAAVATAAGEAARAIMQLQDAATQAADHLKLTSKALQIAQAEYEASKAVYGMLLDPSRTRKYLERSSMLGGSTAGAIPWMYLGNLRTNIENIAVRPRNILNSNPVMTAIMQTFGDISTLPETMREARRNMVRMHDAYKASWQSPEEMWKRIQAAAISPKSMEEELYRKQLALIDKEISTTTKFAEAVDRWSRFIPSRSPTDYIPEGNSKNVANTLAGAYDIISGIVGVWQ